jgi:hypothetical protein
MRSSRDIQFKPPTEAHPYISNRSERSNAIPKPHKQKDKCSGGKDNLRLQTYNFNACRKQKYISETNIE